MPTTNRTPRPLSGGMDLRGAPRVGADYPVELFVNDLPGPLAGRTRDLGITGLCVATPSVFAIKALHRVVIALPNGERLRAQAEARWQRESASDPSILTGVSLVEPPAEVINALWDVVLDAGKELARFLYAHSDLHGLGVEEALGIAQISRYRDLPPGATIYRQDSSRPGDDSIFVVTSGSVLLQVRVRGARETLIARLGPGQMFGGAPLVAESPHPETALADTNVRLLEVDRDAWSYLQSARPWLAQRLASNLNRTVARRLTDVLARVRDQL